MLLENDYQHNDSIKRTAHFKVEMGAVNLERVHEIFINVCHELKA